ncbi:KR domain-containing protein [Micromonospora sp. M12]
MVADHGVRHLLLLSRRPAVVDGLPPEVHVRSLACDVADREQLAGALAQVPVEHPLTAVIHTAGVLDDGVVEALTRDGWPPFSGPRRTRHATWTS